MNLLTICCLVLCSGVAYISASKPPYSPLEMSFFCSYLMQIYNSMAVVYHTDRREGATDTGAYESRPVGAFSRLGAPILADGNFFGPRTFSFGNANSCYTGLYYHQMWKTREAFGPILFNRHCLCFQEIRKNQALAKWKITEWLNLKIVRGSVEG